MFAWMTAYHILYQYVYLLPFIQMENIENPFETDGSRSLFQPFNNSNEQTIKFLQFLAF